MATTKLLFGSKTNITITLASLTNNSLRQSTYIDNGTNLFLDAMVAGFIKGASSGVGATGAVNIYVYGSIDGGTTYSDGASGSDAAFTYNKNCLLLGIATLDANSETAKFGPFSVASAFGGFLPDRWGVIVENKTAATLDATGGNHEIHYRGVYLQHV